MPLLTTSEALRVSDSFFSSLYGEDIFRRWKELKDEMKFITEREYVNWLIDVANHYKNEDRLNEQQQHVEAAYDDESDVAVHRVTSSPVYRDSGWSSGGLSSPLVGDMNIGTDKTSGPEDDLHSKWLELPPPDVNDSRTPVIGDGVGGEKVEVVDDGILISEDTHDDHAAIPNPEQHFPYALISDSKLTALGNPLGLSPPFKKSAARHLKQQQQSCPYCLFSGLNVRRHIETVHERRKPYQCDFCTYSASLKQTLQQHLVLRHGVNSKFSCSTCGKNFTRLKTLEKHGVKCRTSHQVYAAGTYPADS